MLLSPAAQKIESNDLTLEDLYKDFYVVPDFQREYVWQPENVEKLLNDIYDEFFDESGALVSGPEYFIGSIVVCRDEQNRFSLIDGQQRMTTTYLALCAMRDRLKEQGASVSVLDGQIFATSLDDIGNEVPRYRLTLQYEDSHDILELVASPSGEISSSDLKTASMRNIHAAYVAVDEFLKANFQGDVERVRRFMAAFTKRVKLIRIVTPSLTHALKVFETINDRGVGLNAMDLLKNLLFIRTHSKDYSKLKDGWKKLVDTLDGCREKPLRFLRYYIMSSYETDSKTVLREDEIYEWFVRNSAEVGIAADPLGFLSGLVAAAQAYARFTESKDPQGEPNRFLKNIALLSGSARQHFVLLLAGRELPPPLFERLCAEVENLFFAYLITREPTKTFERNFAKWSGALRMVETDVDLDAFLAARFRPDLAGKAATFDFSFRELRTSSIQQYRMRYVLAKLTQHIDSAAWSSAGSHDLKAYVDKSVHIEHVMPQKPTNAVREGFDKPDAYDDYAQRLGNLCLLEATINTSIGNNSFAAKRSALVQSKFLLTRSIAERPSVGSNTQINSAVSSLTPFDDWTSESIERRQEELGSLARRVWGIDAASGAGVDQ